MRARRTPSSNFVFRLGGGTEDNDLHVKVVEPGELGLDESDPCAGLPALVSVWEPSQGERAMIGSGANVELAILGVSQPPVTLGVTREQATSRPQRTHDGPTCWIELTEVGAIAMRAAVLFAIENGSISDSRRGRLVEAVALLDPLIDAMSEESTLCDCASGMCKGLVAMQCRRKRDAS